MGKEKKSYWKGYDDGRKERESPTNPLTAVISGTRYNPPSETRGEREAYKAGFRRGYKER